MKPIFDLTPAGWLRMVVYAVASLVGVAALVATSMGKPEWGEYLGTLASAGVALIGGTAIANLPKAPDQNRPVKAQGVDAVLAVLRDILAATDTKETPEVTPETTPEPEGVAPSLTPAPDTPRLPVFHMPGSGT